MGSNLSELFGVGIVVLSVQYALNDLLLAVLALQGHAEFEAPSAFFVVIGRFSAFLGDQLGLAAKVLDVGSTVPQFLAVGAFTKTRESGLDFMDFVVLLKGHSILLVVFYHWLSARREGGGSTEPFVVGAGGHFFERRKAHDDGWIRWEGLSEISWVRCCYLDE